MYTVSCKKLLTHSNLSNLIMFWQESCVCHYQGNVIKGAVIDTMRMRMVTLQRYTGLAAVVQYAGLHAN